jgi:alpha-maltose-1-phosphate synthase
MDMGGNRDKPTVLLSRTTVNQNTRHALRSLIEHDMLAEFWTTFVWDPKSIWNSLLPQGLQAQLARRAISEAPAHMVRGVPWREIVRLSVRGTVVENFLCSGKRPFSIMAMGIGFDARVARRVRELWPDMVYAYEDGGLQTYREAKKMGVTTIHEQPSAYWRWTRDLFAEEANLYPEFASLLPDTRNVAIHAEWKEEELRLADYVVVPSEHVRSTLKDIVPKEKIRMIPYGAPEVRPRQHFNYDSNAPLKVLFVGNLIQRKGIGYLLEAVDMLGRQAELTMVGRRLGPNIKVDEACRRCRWIETLPHGKVMSLMQESDVLVLPSLSDAFGLVVTEALACGLPVIVTPNAGGSEIICDGREGYIVPIRRADLIASRLDALHSDRTMLAEMSQRALETAAQNSWEHYRLNWAHMIRGLACH